jgi:hypothetical protein
MTLGDFGLSTFASVLANQLDKFLGRNSSSDSAPQSAPSVDSSVVPPNPISSLGFKTFDAWHDLPRFISSVRNPLVSILIEDQPSTLYRLPAIVLESQDTREWFVFSRGRMSFEGSGNSLNNSRYIIEMLKKKNIPIGVWVVEKSSLEKMECGLSLWPEIRNRAVPLLAVMAKDQPWFEILNNTDKLLS